MKRLNKIAKKVDVGETWQLDLELLKKYVLRDYSDVTGEIQGNIQSAKNLNISNDFEDIECVFEMDDLDEALEFVSKRELLEGIQNKNIKINLEDKYIVYKSDGKYVSTSKDLEKAFEELGQKVLDVIIKSVENGKFNDVYDNYTLSSIDEAIVEK